MEMLIVSTFPVVPLIFFFHMLQTETFVDDWHRFCYRLNAFPTVIPVVLKHKRELEELGPDFVAIITSNGSPSAMGPLSVLSVCNIGVLWPNGWMDQDTTWYGGRPRPRRRGVRWGPSCPHGKGHSSPPHFSALIYFGPCLLWPNGRPSQQLLSYCQNFLGWF